MAGVTRRVGFSILILFVACVCLAGCGPDGPEVVPVEGTVTLDGQPVSGALVFFTPTAGGRPSGGRTNEEGWYELTYSQSTMGALPGEHSVEISTFREGDVGQDIEPAPETLPARYNARTELKKTVEADGSVIDFKLTSDGEVIQPRF